MRLTPKKELVNHIRKKTTTHILWTCHEKEKKLLCQDNRKVGKEERQNKTKRDDARLDSFAPDIR